MDFLNPFEDITKHGAHLPHWQQGEVMQFVTFRLGDAMPETKLRLWREEHNIWRQVHPEPWSADEEREYHRRFTWRVEHWLDEGSGSCLLAEPERGQSSNRRCCATTARGPCITRWC